MNTIRSLKILVLGVILLNVVRASAEPVHLGPGGFAGVLCSSKFINGKREAAQDPSRNQSFSSDKTSVIFNCLYSDPKDNVSRGPYICESHSGAPVEITIDPFANDHGDWTGHVRCNVKRPQQR